MVSKLSSPHSSGRASPSCSGLYPDEFWNHQGQHSLCREPVPQLHCPCSWSASRSSLCAPHTHILSPRVCTDFQQKSRGQNRQKRKKILFAHYCFGIAWVTVALEQPLSITCAARFSHFSLKTEMISFFPSKIMKTTHYHEASAQAQYHILHSHLLIVISSCCTSSLGLL